MCPITQLSRLEDRHYQRPVIIRSRVFKINTVVRVFQTLVTDIQNVYGDTKNDFVKSLVRFDKSLQDAGLLLLKRVDDNVGVLLTGREGLSSFQRRLAYDFSG